MTETTTPTLLADALEPDHSHAIVAIVKRTYAFKSEASPKLTLADEQVPIRRRIELDLVTQEFRDDCDVRPQKPATDVVVLGSAYTEKRAREVLIAIAIGNLARQLRVTGDRHAEVAADGTIHFSEADSFDSLVLNDAIAYGGYDEFAQDVLAPVSSEFITQCGFKPTQNFAYPRNRIGRAYFVDVERTRANGAALPRIEDPSDALTPERFFVPSADAWIDAPISARLGWVHPARYPRLGRIAGRLLEHETPSRPIRETQFSDGDDLPALRELETSRPNPRILQGASPGLACERLRGDELVILKHLHREVPELRFNLPGEAPRISVKPNGLRALTPRAVLNTVRIEPDRDRVSLTWCASIASAGPVGPDALAAFALDVTFARLS